MLHRIKRIMIQTVNNTDIEFEPIPDWDKYYISRCGKVLSLQGETPPLLKKQRCSKGVRTVDLYKAWKVKTIGVHRLLCLTHLPNPDKHTCVHHINGDKQDNRLENLQWCSRSTVNVHSSIRKNNTSGNTGVCYKKNRESWVALWTDPNDKKYEKSKYFSIKKHGEEAKKLAIE